MAGTEIFTPASPFQILSSLALCYRASPAFNNDDSDKIPPENADIIHGVQIVRYFNENTEVGVKILEGDLLVVD